MTRPDPSSYANHDVAPVTHMHLSLAADFAAQTLSGYAEASVNAPAPVDAVVFDLNGLNIASVKLVTHAADGAESLASADYWISYTEGKLGQALVVRLPAGTATATVRIYYSTVPTASAIQWLAPEQTEGKEHPYLFTQCQAIHARSLFPCQDSPGIKFTYSADVTVPAPLQALMSAVLQSTEPEAAPASAAAGAMQTWRFKQAVPIPSYLVALCVGNLKKADISDRCAVWAEPEKLDAAAYEFGETEKFLQAAEDLCGPYVWGRYDLLLMPPSYPYGGMENACLTFVTPTLLAGDRSLANVVAHEIAHSWSGNLVTNKTWESFFLNEGFTVFIERKILERLYGAEFKGLHSIIGWEDLKGSIGQYGASHPFTCLQVDIGSDDPDDAFSSVPYEKGCTLLTHFETLVGGATVMDKFLKAYFAHFKYQSISTDDFRAFFLSFARDNGVAADALASIDWQTLLHTPGLPVKPAFNDALARDVAETATRAIAGELPEAPKQWTSTQVIVYLDRLIDAHEEAVAEADAAGADARAAVDAAWATKLLPAVARVVPSMDALKKNPEHCFRFLTLLARAGDTSAAGAADAIVAQCDAFLASNGRMKFVRPLYRDLFNSATLNKGGAGIFAKYKAQYHNICSKMVERDLGAAAPKWR
jgi:leukotriene-A4 hydrolase